jgi:hypothetical protein
MNNSQNGLHVVVTSSATLSHMRMSSTPHGLTAAHSVTVTIYTVTASVHGSAEPLSNTQLQGSHRLKGDQDGNHANPNHFQCKKNAPTAYGGIHGGCTWQGVSSARPIATLVPITCLFQLRRYVIGSNSGQHHRSHMQGYTSTSAHMQLLTEKLWNIHTPCLP